MKILSVPYAVSNRKMEEIDGLSAKLHGEQIGDFSCYLIGQLSKNSSIQKKNCKYVIENYDDSLKFSDNDCCLKGAMIY